MTDKPGLFIQLYTDEDVTTALAIALRERGYVAQSAVEASMQNQDDEVHLAYATARGMSLMTYNEKDFVPIAQRWALQGRDRAGIVVSEQFSLDQLGELLRRALKLLDTLTAGEMQNAFVYLSQFR